ncbi:MAG: hypothetical protein WBQ32_12040 [Ignavibacteriaceae bacterium]
MKTLFVTLVAFSLALLIGCQENLLNEPGNLIEKKTDPANKGSLKICCELQDPFSGICNLNGLVNYVHKKENVAMNPIGSSGIELHLEMNANLCGPLGMVHPEWRAEGRSDDFVYVSEEGILLIEKSYNITNRTDVVVAVLYMVTTDGVGISKVRLVEVEK